MYITHCEDVSVFLLPSIPLNSFTFTTGFIWDQSRSRDFRGILGILLSYYHNTLGETRHSIPNRFFCLNYWDPICIFFPEKIHLNIRNNRESLDDLLIEMIEKCSNLTSLQFSGVLRNIKTIKKICEIQKNSQNRELIILNYWRNIVYRTSFTILGFS